MRYKIAKGCVSAVLSLYLSAGAVITVSAQGNNGPPGDSSCTLSIPISVCDNRGRIPDGTEFTVTISPVGEAPLPEKTSYVTDVAGDFEFGPIVFDEPGNYEYTVRELEYDSDKIIFDETVYRVRAAVLWDAEGKLTAGCAVTEEGSGKKSEELIFENDYKRSSGQNEEPDSSPPDDSRHYDDSGGADESSKPPGDSSSGTEDSTSADSSSPGDEDSSSPGDEDSSGSGDGSSDESEPWGGFLPPATGGAVAIGSVGAVFIGLAVILAGRRKNSNSDEPPDKRSG